MTFLFDVKKCQKIPKTLAVGYNLLPTQRGVTFCPTPLQKKEALSGFLEVGVLLAEDVGDPEATDVVGQGLGTHQSEAILFTYMLKLYSYVISHFENYIKNIFFEINDSLYGKL